MSAKRVLEAGPLVAQPPVALHPTFKGRPPARVRVADQVFETLSRAILNGDLHPGEVLATQRELSKQFAVSPLVVRQAIHRLEELGLVRVRQGSTTSVLDPNEASDVRLLQLQLELATPGDALALAAAENQGLSVLPLLVLAERRITDEELTVLEQLTDAMPEQPESQDQMRFRLQYWRHIAEATRNPVLQHQVRWWSRVMLNLDERGHGGARPRPAPMLLYRALNGALRKRRGAVDIWLQVLSSLFDWTEAQPSHRQHRTAQPAAPPAAKVSRKR